MLDTRAAADAFFHASKRLTAVFALTDRVEP